MSCVLAVGMSMPAFATEQGSSPITTTLLNKPATLEFKVPTSIPFTVQNLVAGKASSIADAITMNPGSIRIDNFSDSELKMSAVGITPTSINTDWSNMDIQPTGEVTNAATPPTKDCMGFQVSIYNDSKQSVLPFVNSKFSHDAIPYNFGIEASAMAHEDPKYQTAAYRNFDVHMPTTKSFYIDILHPAVYITPAGAAKINNTPTSYFNMVFTLGLD